MANSAQARKRARQAVVRRTRNVSNRSSLRTAIKKVINAVAAGDKESASSAYQAVVPIIDKMARSGLIHTNKAARHKSRLNASVRAI